MLTLNEYQTDTEETAIYPHRYEYQGLMYLGLGLAGEAGEVADNVKKAFRDDNEELTKERREAMKYELGDCLWYIAEMARVLGWTLEDVASANTQKLRSRKQRGVLGGSGDKR